MSFVYGCESDRIRETCGHSMDDRGTHAYSIKDGWGIECAACHEKRKNSGFVGEWPQTYSGEWWRKYCLAILGIVLLAWYFGFMRGQNHGLSVARQRLAADNPALARQWAVEDSLEVEANARPGMNAYGDYEGY